MLLNFPFIGLSSCLLSLIACMQWIDVAYYYSCSVVSVCLSVCGSVCMYSGVAKVGLYYVLIIG